MVIFRCYFERILIILFGSAAVDAAAAAEESIKTRGKRRGIIQLHELWLSAHKFEDFEWKREPKAGGEEVFPESNNKRQFDSMRWIVLIKIHNQLYHEYSIFGRFLFSPSAYMFIPPTMHILIRIFVSSERLHSSTFRVGRSYCAQTAIAAFVISNSAINKIFSALHIGRRSSCTIDRQREKNHFSSERYFSEAPGEVDATGFRLIDRRLIKFEEDGEARTQRHQMKKLISLLGSPRGSDEVTSTRDTRRPASGQRRRY